MTDEQNPLPALQPRESLFVAEIIKGTAAEHAAVAAGWAPKYARKHAHIILRRPQIQAAIAEAQERVRAESEMTAERLLTMFLETHTKAIEWRQSTGAARALELIGKLTGLLQERVKLEVEVKPSLIGAIEAGRQRVGAVRAAVPLMLDVTPKPAVVSPEPAVAPSALDPFEK